MTPAVLDQPYPDDIVAAYRMEGYWRDETIPDVVLHHATTSPERVAVVGESTLTYAELDALVRRWIGILGQLGVRQHAVVGVQLTNTVGFVGVLLALINVGAVPILIVPSLGPREVCHVLRVGGASALIVDGVFQRGGLLSLARAVRKEIGPSLAVFVMNAPNQIDVDGMDPRALERDFDTTDLESPTRRAEDIAFFLLSGGTTGPPKLIPRRHHDYVYNIRISAELCALDDRTVYLAALPVSHNFALGCPGILGTLSRGGRVVLAPRPDAGCVLPLIARDRVTIVAAVPSLILDWCDAISASAFDLTSLQLVQVGGSRLYRRQAERLLETLGCKLQQVYGMAEGMLNFTRLDDPVDVIIDTQGRPASPGDEFRIVDSGGRDVTRGEPGELLVRGPYTIRRYHADSRTNAAAFTASGFYRTGDLVRLHPTGNLVVEGRVRELINRAGEKVSPAELEDLLANHRAISKSAVVGVEDDRVGERVWVFVVPKSGWRIDLADLRNYLKSQGLARFKLPEHLVVLDSLPLTPVGKVDKVALRQRSAEIRLNA